MYIVKPLGNLQQGMCVSLCMKHMSLIAKVLKRNLEPILLMISASHRPVLHSSQSIFVCIARQQTYDMTEMKKEVSYDFWHCLIVAPIKSQPNVWEITQNRFNQIWVDPHTFWVIKTLPCFGWFLKTYWVQILNGYWVIFP